MSLSFTHFMVFTRIRKCRTLDQFSLEPITFHMYLDWKFPQHICCIIVTMWLDNLHSQVPSPIQWVHMMDMCSVLLLNYWFGPLVLNALTSRGPISSLSLFHVSCAALPSPVVLPYSTRSRFHCSCGYRLSFPLISHFDSSFKCSLTSVTWYWNLEFYFTSPLKIYHRCLLSRQLSSNFTKPVIQK